MMEPPERGGKGDVCGHECHREWKRAGGGAASLRRHGRLLRLGGRPAIGSVNGSGSLWLEWLWVHPSGPSLGSSAGSRSR